MITDTERHRRADAARNAERILRVTREVYAELGPDAPLDEIARRAGVDIRTLYRHFPNKPLLAQAALEQSVAEQLSPAVERALGDDDPLHGLAELMGAAISMAARELNTLAVARSAGPIPVDMRTPFYESLASLARRAQQQGLVRDDLVPDDLPRILGMLFSVLGAPGIEHDGWRRYLTLILDGLSPAAATALPGPSSAGGVS